MLDRTRNLVLLVAGLLMALIGPPVLYLTGKGEAESAASLRAEGRQTTGRATKVWRRSRKRDEITYAFEANGRTYERMEKAAREDTLTLLPGSPVQVTYLPRDPSVSTLNPAQMESASRNMTTWGPFLMAGVGLLLAGVGAWRLKASQ